MKLNGSLTAAGDVDAQYAPSFRISPDSSRVLYVADELAQIQNGLFSVPIGGGAPRMRLDSPLDPAATNLQSFAFSLDGAWAAFVAQRTRGVSELFVAPSDGSAPSERMNAPLVLGGDVSAAPQSYAFTADSRRILYLADQESDEVLELFMSFLGRRIRRTR